MNNLHLHSNKWLKPSRLPVDNEMFLVVFNDGNLRRG